MIDAQKTRKKVLVLVTLGELGGAQKYVRDIVEGLKDEHDFTIGSGTQTGDELLDWAQKNGVNAVQFSSLKRGLTLGTLPAPSDFAFFIELVRHMRAERYHIVHLNSSKVGYLGALASFFAPSTKTVFTAHGWAFDDPTVGRGWKKWLWVAVNKFGAYFLDYIITICEQDRQSALRYHTAPPRKIYTVYNGFDETSVRFLSRPKAKEWLQARTGIAPHESVVGTIANLYKTKDLKMLIAAVSFIPEPTRTHLVVMGGEGSDSQVNLMNHARRLGVAERVHFLGRVEGASTYLRAFDAYAISSVKEGLPFSLFEAMAAGVPIVSTAVGGIPEVLAEDAGVLVPPKNSQKLAEALSMVLTSASVSKKLTKNARQHLAAFSYERMIQGTRWVYEL